MYMEILGITQLNFLIHPPNHDHQQGPPSVPVVSRAAAAVQRYLCQMIRLWRGGLLEPYVRSRARQ
jgi:hypothetical protein